jgi:hypothetical protein
VTARVVAVDHIRSLDRGCQAHLIRCSDGFDYLVKFPNDPSGAKTLACDLLGTLLAIQLGLPVLLPQLIEVPPDLVENTPGPVITLEKGTIPCQSGTYFGSRYPYMADGKAVPVVAMVTDFWQDESKSEIRNVSDCAGIFVFDQWTCNTGTREFLFQRTPEARTWRLSMTDQSHCFNGSRWNFPNSPLWGLHHGLAPYTRERRLSVFEPWLERLERGVDRESIRSAAQSVPPHWYDADTCGLERLQDQLDRRRTQVKDLIWTVIARLPADFWSRPSYLGSSGACIWPRYLVDDLPLDRADQRSLTMKSPHAAKS